LSILIQFKIYKTTILKNVLNSYNIDLFYFSIADLITFKSLISFVIF